jgi:formamidopyrimidine-DNA glycosylase
MPELPEVEGAARYLDAQIAGRTLRSVAWLHASLQRHAAARVPALIGRRVAAVRRVAKWQEVQFTDGAVLVVHFRMTGDWAVTAKPVAPAHARAHFAFSGSRHVWLIDPRVLSRVEMREAGEAPTSRAVGPDALDPALDGRMLRARMATRSAPIKQVLLDQAVIAGIGNIYAAEALWHARIHPGTPAQQLSVVRVDRLLEGVRWTMGLAFDAMGRHQYGTATERFSVYDREGQPCPRCGAPISRSTQGQRSTYWCRRCQRS